MSCVPIMHCIIFFGLVLRVASSLSSHVIDLFPNGTNHLENAFNKVYAHMNETCAAFVWLIGYPLGTLFDRFDYKLYQTFSDAVRNGVGSADTDAYTSYAYYPKGCVLAELRLHLHLLIFYQASLRQGAQARICVRSFVATRILCLFHAHFIVDVSHELRQKNTAWRQPCAKDCI